MVDCKLIREDQGNVIMADNEMSKTENEEAKVTVIESSKGVSLDDCTITSSTSESTDSSPKSHVVWRYFDNNSGETVNVRCAGNTERLWKYYLR